MYRYALITLPIALLTACNDGETREVGSFHAVENQTDAKTEFYDGDEANPPAEPPDEIEIRCSSGATANVATTVDNGTLVIAGSAGSDCRILIPNDGVDHVVIRGDGQVDCDDDWRELESIELTGNSDVHLSSVEGGTFEIHSTGGAELVVDQMDVDHLELDVSGNSETTVYGNSDDAEIVATGDAAVWARDCIVDDLFLDVSGNATVEATATGTVDGDVSGSGHVDLWGGAEILGDLLVSVGLSLHDD